TPAETRQVVESACVAAMYAGCVVAAQGASRRGSGGRQMDGEVLEIKTGTDEAGPFGSAQQAERDQQAAPGIAFEPGSDGEGIPLLRPRVIKSAGDPIAVKIWRCIADGSWEARMSVGRIAASLIEAAEPSSGDLRRTSRRRIRRPRSP